MKTTVVSTGVAAVPAGQEKGELGEFRNKLLSFLDISTSYEPARLISDFPFDGRNSCLKCFLRINGGVILGNAVGSGLSFAATCDFILREKLFCSDAAGCSFSPQFPSPRLAGRTGFASGSDG